MRLHRHEYDVVVVGAGGAGLRAAIESAAQGRRTALVCKSLLGKAHTVMAEGGAAAALGNADARDNWKVHFRDTMRGGKFLNNWRMAEIHAKEAPDRIRELERWGAVFDRTKDGWINQRNFGGHTYPRLAHVGDRTGLEIIRTLQDKGVHSGLDVFMEYTVVRIFKDAAGNVNGCLAYTRDTGEFHLFETRAVVLATGGFGKAFQVTSNSWEYTGDGYAMAYQAGAELMDMEFIQFHPTGMVWPPSVRGILVTEGVRGEGGILRNTNGERFMFRYVPDLFKGEFAETEEEAKRWLEGDKTARRPPELLTRDVVARAIMAEVKSGRGTPRGGVYLDISWREADYVRAKLPSMYHQFKELAGVDITKEPMEVGPTMHYIMGGIRVDPDTEMTNVPGLFAAGECAAGLHGANRLGGNSLSDLLVFGQRAGAGAASYARGLPSTPEVDPAEVYAAVAHALEPFDRATGESPFAVMDALQEIMQANAGMVRFRDELEHAAKEIEALRHRAAKVRVAGTREFNPGWHVAMDLPNLLVASEAIALSALAREESRGGHTRGDFTDADEEKWGKTWVVCRRENGRMKVVLEPVVPMPADLKAIVSGKAEDVATKKEASA
ncbi:MAG TPA: fumarate reductase/succinate dehydrogenase flavoprotein subunit [Candidatus Thermoplasmatota archaeon]|nr:fumarate reductase/succinate dehydrogenase flavoprotein subunit [Candidatus Thermoplasmatota archaeon]